MRACMQGSDAVLHPGNDFTLQVVDHGSTRNGEQEGEQHGNNQLHKLSRKDQGGQLASYAGREDACVSHGVSPFGSVFPIRFVAAGLSPYPPSLKDGEGGEGLGRGVLRLVWGSNVGTVGAFVALFF